MNLSVVIPAFNEESCLVSTLSQIYGYFNNRPNGLARLAEVIVVDDGSTDQTAAIVKNAGFANLKLISHRQNLGKGAAVKTGVKASIGEAVLFLDADYSTKIEELDNFLPKLNECWDIIIGSRGMPDSRILKSQPIFKELLGRLGNLLIRLLAVPGVADSQCGFKLFNRRSLAIFNQQTIQRWLFDVELLFIAKKYDFKMLELPVAWTNDRFSKVKKSDYLKTLIELVKIRLNDLKGLYEKK
ncbi:MAG: glycosyltransferase family 2 protein [Candidatus Komeilibacteria bacterium]|nr:glycosyltransferase family 2 protein [Candidatus Komeilibacteria bacterium]